ncbi:MAG: hypothetical protein ACREPQ_14030 [Rhodanobacter sp.]
MEEKTNAEFPFGLVVSLGLWSVVVAAAAAYATWYYVCQRVDSQLSTRPPIAVMNSADWALYGGTGPTAADQVRDGMKRYLTAVKKLGDAGFLVLDGRIVPSAPTGIFVQPPKNDAATAKAVMELQQQ